jgi:hypothetical protein
MGRDWREHPVNGLRHDATKVHPRGSLDFPNGCFKDAGQLSTDRRFSKVSA